MLLLFVSTARTWSSREHLLTKEGLLVRRQTGFGAAAMEDHWLWKPVSEGTLGFNFRTLALAWGPGYRGGARREHHTPGNKRTSVLLNQTGRKPVFTVHVGQLPRAQSRTRGRQKASSRASLTPHLFWQLRTQLVNLLERQLNYWLANRDTEWEPGEFPGGSVKT